MYFLVCRSELACNWGPRRGEGDSHKKGAGMLVGNFFLPVKEISLGVAQLFLTPKETILHFDYMN